MKKMVAVFMAFVLVGALTPSLAYASDITVGKADFTTETAKLDKVAKAVKVGKSKIVLKKGIGYLKFKATKNKVYSFTFSDLKCANSSSAYAYVQQPDTHSPQYSWMADVSTYGGKTKTLWLGVNGKTHEYGEKVNYGLKSRTGKIKLKKGNEVYLFMHVGEKKATATLQVK